MSKIAEGYKQTEVGVIPNDWEVKKLGDCLLQNPDYGINAAAVPYNEGLPVYLRITDITEDGRYSKKNIVSVNNIDSTSFFLEWGEIVFARTGASVGKTYLYNPDDGRLVFAGFLIRVKTNPNVLNSNYLKFFTQTSYYWNWVRSNSMRTGQPGINSNEYKELPIPLPHTKAEQTAIATALNDADKLITELEKLIAKKRNIKQGAMQELLRPKEGWVEKTIGELFEVTAGGDFKKEFSTEVKDEKHQYPIYSNSLVNEGLYGYCSYYINTENCVTVTARGTIGYAVYRDHIFSAIGRVIVLCPKEEIDCFYISEYINNKIKFVLEVTGVPQLTAPQISKYLVSLPPAKEEQTRIAQILSDMDAEIEALEKKLDKYKIIKQGMMQNLLTGKARLV